MTKAQERAIRSERLLERCLSTLIAIQPHLKPIENNMGRSLAYTYLEDMIAELKEYSSNNSMTDQSQSVGKVGACRG